MARLEDRYWWFQARRYLTRSLLASHGVPRGSVILDAGCGTGGTFAALAAQYTVVGLDRSLVALAFCRKRGMELLVGGDLQSIPLADASFDAVVACDVLEHVQDDQLALRELFRVSRPGAVLVVTVPALPWLWSEHDEALGHMRRYTKRDLMTRIRAAGWRLRRLNYAVSGLLPPIVLFRLWRRMARRSGAPRVDLFELPGPINSLLAMLSKLESWVAIRVPLPPGASLIAVATKPKE
ncbi:MAG: class I SAM-dependent methyltransferase [Armatimonadetes bacterium]|nr:class I SAM-dependent methyltransferase [Armatimonadota bacterium]